MDSRVSDKYSLPQLPLLGKPNGRKIAICLQSDMKPELLQSRPSFLNPQKRQTASKTVLFNNPCCT